MSNRGLNPLYWTVDETREWALTQNIHPAVVERLYAHKIDGPTLTYLNEAALQELGTPLPNQTNPPFWTKEWWGEQSAELSIQISTLIKGEQLEFTGGKLGLHPSIKASIPELELVIQGYVRKLGSKRKNWRSRHLRLHSDGLLTYYKTDAIEDDVLGELVLVNVRSIRTGLQTDWGSGCPSDALPDCRIELVTDERMFRFYVESKEDASTWITALKDSRKISIERKSTIVKRNLAMTRSRFLEHDVLKRRMVAVKKGWVTKHGVRGRNWKRRYLVLTQSNTVHYWKDDRCQGAPIGSINLKYCAKLVFLGDCNWTFGTPSIATVDKRFEIFTDTRQYQFFAWDSEDANSWVEALGKSFEQAHKLPFGTRESVRCRTPKITLADAVEFVEADDEEDDEDEDEDDTDAEVLHHNNPADRADDHKSFFIDRYLDMYNLPHTAERRRILLEALRLGRTDSERNRKRHIQIIYNPVSGAGKAKKNVDYTVVPVLEIAGIDFKVTATTHRGFAREFATNLNFKTTTGIIIAGGDGLVSEVISGLMDRTDNCIDSGFPIGIIPSGTANAMANELDCFESKSYIELIGATALMVARGVTRKIDLIEMKSEDATVCGLSCVGWGLAGAVALKADQLRWLPGQRNFRYDIAGFVTLMKNWPLDCAADFEFLTKVESEKNEDSEDTNTPKFEWKKESIQMINMIATNCERLGVDHPIDREAKIDDGLLSVVFMGGAHSRTDAARAGRSMKSGNYLAEHKLMSQYRVSEFKMTPTSATDIPLLIDGDPWGIAPVHVKVHHQKLTVFCKPT
eukprot:m.43466 g.43466  ORF g.43466 m.43466 type:complete len:799 (+) comp19380_c0_seq1:87-2483(+)